MRLVFRVATGVAALAALSQAWITFNWIGWSDDHCDYPEECLSTWLPRAFALAEYLWVVTAVAGATAVVAAGLLQRRRVDIGALGGAWVAAFMSYCLTPMIQATPGEPILDWRPIEANSLYWGGPGYTLVALLMAAAGAVFGWQLLRSKGSTARPTTLGIPQLTDAEQR